ncbi:MAG: signal peptidase II [Planctomycetes bacterium]|nr:signal peptidase II [Planctomycetota bacterium]
METAGGAESAMKSRALVRLGWVLGLVLLDLITKSVVFAWVGELDAAGELVRDHDGHRRYPLLGTEWFAFMLSTNPGAAFGQLGNIPHLLVALRIACVFLLGTWLLGVEGGRRASTVALALVLSGAAGNLYDNLMLVDSGAAMAAHVAVFLVFGAAWCLGSTKTRWGATAVLLGVALILQLSGAEGTYGAVRDFIDVYTPQWRDTLPWGSHFPTFNVADSCISVGAVLLLITGFGEREKDEAEAIAQTPEED